MSTNEAGPATKSIDKLIPWFFVVFFLTLTALMTWFAWLANSTDRGVVSKHAYQNGLAYNQILEKQREQDALGWQTELSIKKEGGTPAKAEFILRDKNNAAINDALVQLSFIRPTQAGHDVTLMLTPRGNGRYTGETPLTLPGLWDAHITVKSGAHTVQTSKRVTLP